MNKTEQILLQDVLRKALISMISLKGRETELLPVDDGTNGHAGEVEELGPNVLEGASELQYSHIESENGYSDDHILPPASAGHLAVRASMLL